MPSASSGILETDDGSTSQGWTDVPQPPEQRPRLMHRIGVVDPSSLDDYRAHGGYTALARAFELGPERVIAEVTESRLLGRGGAAFPTGRKWAAVAAQAAQPHYLVCNADESEPGTFKDRVLLEGDPFATVEAMTIAAFATGASKGYLYIRGEYPEAEARVANAIDRARDAGLLGDDILGSGFAFDIELRRGAGAYICGEETALFESIEGKRGEPRNKPPFPVEVGLFGKPTVVNNVETLANVLSIVTRRWRDVRPDRHRGLDRARSSSACRAMSRGPASTRSSSGRRCATSSRWPAACRADARSGRSCSVAPRASSSGRARWTCRSPSRRRGRTGRRSARA